MDTKLDPLVTERAFFSALLSANIDALDAILTDDFVIVDLMEGGEISKPMLLAAVGSSQVKFEAIEQVESKVRIYATDTAIIVGRTEMRVRSGGQSFSASSRYTHVFVLQNGGWQLASAQGTQIR
jgi:ketosteroid isomerase-like protein